MTAHEAAHALEKTREQFERELKAIGDQRATLGMRREQIELGIAAIDRALDALMRDPNQDGLHG